MRMKVPFCVGLVLVIISVSFMVYDKTLSPLPVLGCVVGVIFMGVSIGSLYSRSWAGIEGNKW